MPEGYANKKLSIVFQVFLIKCDDKLILVDAGCETMPEFEMFKMDSDCGTCGN